MYVCLCRAVTDSQIRIAIGQGMASRKQLVECFGIGRDCGKCNDEIKALLVDPYCDLLCDNPCHRRETTGSSAPRRVPTETATL